MMKKSILLSLIFLFQLSVSYSQVFPFNDDYESYTAFNVPSGYNGNITVYLTHGTNSSKGLAGFLTSFSNKDSIYFPAIGPVTQFSTLEFDWRMMDPGLYPSTPATLAAGDSFDFLISTDGFTYSSLFNINSTNYVSSTNFLHESISLSAYSGSIIFLKIIGMRANGSAEFFIDVDNVLVDEPGVIYANNLPSFTVYPTLVSGKLNFENPTDLNGNIRIIDGCGKIVLEKKLESVRSGELDLSTLPSGKYFVIVESQSGNKITPIIIR